MKQFHVSAIVLTILIFSGFSLVFGQAIKWGHSIGNHKNLSSNYIQYLHDVEFFNESTLYASGRFNDTLVLGSHSLSDNFGQVWLSKIDTTGKIHWTKSIGEKLNTGGSPLIDIYVLKADSIGNCLYVGGYIGSGIFKFGRDTLSTSGGELFVAKLDTAGNAIWAKSTQKIGTPPIPLISVDDIAVMPGGGMVLTGTHGGKRQWLGDTLDIVNSQNRRNGFVTRLDSSGQKLWTAPFHATYGSLGNYSTFGKSVVINPDGSVLVTGISKGTLHFGALSESMVNYHSFLSKLDASGVPQWIKKLGRVQYISNPQSNVLERFGNHIYGAFETSATFNIPDINQSFTPYSGGRTSLILKMDLNGQILQSFNLPTSATTDNSKIFVNKDETQIYALSAFHSSTVANNISYSQDFNLVTFDSSGTITCNAPLENGSFSRAALTGNNKGHLVMGSQLRAPNTFGPVELNNYGTETAFLLSTDASFCGKKNLNLGSLDICPDDSSMQFAPSNYSYYKWSTGEMNDTAYFSTPGPHYCSMRDSSGSYFVSQNFSVNIQNSSISREIVGDSILCHSTDSIHLSASPSWNDVQWNNGAQSGNSLSTDSAGNYFFSAQDPSYPNCTYYSDTFSIIESQPDSLYIINLPTSLCKGDSIRLQYFFSPGIDTSSISLHRNDSIVDISSNAFYHFGKVGWDSLHLSAQNSHSCTWISKLQMIQILELPSPAISRRGDTLFSNYQTNNQWYLNGQLLPTDTLSYLIYNQNGKYELQVTNTDSCTASASYMVQDVAIKERQVFARIEIFPNPAADYITLKLHEATPLPATVSIHDANGKLIRNLSLDESEKRLSTTSFAKGIYIVGYNNQYIKLFKL